MKKLLMIWMVLVACFTMATTAFAMEDGAYGVYANTNYWNPDTGEIDDGGTANAALGEGMCRSATSTKALVEKIGDEYYVTIRLLLQSNTKTARFSKHVGVNQYQSVSYEIMAENGMEDSVDYRFQVADPFAPIKAEMYVTPMGRDVLWYIELDAASISGETGDFVVTAVSSVEETVEIVEEIMEMEEISEEIPEEAVEIVEEVDLISDLAETEEVETVEAVEDNTEEAEIEEVVEEMEEENTTTVVVEKSNNSNSSIVAILVALVVIAVLWFRRKKDGK